MSSVVVIGGGITGLAAAWTLAKDPLVDVTLLEREARLGGKILSEQIDGVTFEGGADAFVARDSAILRLCDDLKLRDDLVAPEVFGALIWSRRRMRSLRPSWVFGLPTSARSVLGSEVLPVGARWRALWDLALPGKLSGDDISIGELVRRRFGDRLLEATVDPLLAGSRAGTADDISLAAALPQLDAIARRSSSVIRGLGSARREGTLPEGPPPFLGIPGGMQQLVQRAENALTSATLRLSSEARTIHATETGYRIGVADGTRLQADAVIVTAPAFAAATLLEDLAPEAARHLYRIQYASSAVAVLVYEGSEDSIPASGSGFLVPSRERRVLSACTWFSKKWSGAAPAGRLVLRCFVGRAGRDASLALDDDDLIALIEAEVVEALGLSTRLKKWRLYRWDRGLPHYRVGHLQLLDKIQAALVHHPGIALAGAGYRGSGLPDCVRQGEGAAVRALNFVTDSRG